MDHSVKVVWQTLLQQTHANSIGLDRMSFLIDRGPKQSEIALATLIAKSNICNSPSDGGYPFDPSWISSQSTTVQVFCEDASINLNWELCELI